MKKLLIAVSLFFLTFITKGQGYLLYGTAESGGVDNDGVIYSYDPYLNKYQVVFNFDGLNGQGPEYDLIQASNGLLYGITGGGGKYGYGTLYSYNIYTGQHNALINFNDTNGNQANGGNFLLQGTNGLLYGTTISGGKYNYGVLYQYDINKNKDSVLLNFDTIYGIAPGTGLTEDTSTGILYGFTEVGGGYAGTLFSYNTKTGKDSVLINFDSTKGAGPLTKPLLTSKGMIYGLTSGGGIYGPGGANNYGVLFRYQISTGKDSVLFNFNGIDGQQPVGEELFFASDGLLYGMTHSGGTHTDGVCFSFDTSNNTEKVLFNFVASNGSSPEGGLMQDPTNGLLYGVAISGGNTGHNDGVIFSYNIATQKDTVLKSFTGADGNIPTGTLLFVKDSLEGINEINTEKESISVYPNPSNGIFNFSISNYEVGIKNTIKVYNVLGEKVSQQSITNSAAFTINLADEPIGVYLYRLVSEKGNLVASGKLIVE